MLKIFKQGLPQKATIWAQVLMVGVGFSTHCLAEPAPSPSQNAELTWPDQEYLSRQAGHTYPPPAPFPVKEFDVGGPTVETLEGATAITVRGSDGKLYSMKTGDELAFGDTFQTGSTGIIRIAYEEGVQVLITPQSQVRINREPDRFGGGPIPALELQKGEVRVLVGHEEGDDDEDAPSQPAGDPDVEPSPSPKPSPIPGRLRFVLKTDQVAMGVRGTDFVVKADSANSEVHTFTGVVDVAENTRDLMSGEVQTAKAGKSVLAQRGHIFKPTDFMMSQFLKEFHGRHPRLEVLWHSAKKDLKSRRISKKFKTFRRAREEGKQAIPRFVPGGDFKPRPAPTHTPVPVKHHSPKIRIKRRRGEFRGHLHR